MKLIFLNAQIIVYVHVRVCVYVCVHVFLLLIIPTNILQSFW